MFDLSIWLTALLGLLIVAVATWGLSVARHNVAIVDSIWAPMFLIAAVIYAWYAPVYEALEGAGMPGGTHAREILVLVLVTVWALRLAVYITARNWGHEEDRRYQAIRARNEPGFTFKSVYLVFAFQAVLAWVISLPLHGAILSPAPLGPLDWLGAALWLVGFVFEAGGDWQLARFKADPANRGKVMDRGFWRYTRHPNYFGDFCVWWGFYLIALSAGAWWSIVGPIIMSALLIKYSGAGLLEKDIAERRPAYADYIRRTNTFFPGPRRD